MTRIFEHRLTYAVVQRMYDLNFEGSSLPYAEIKSRITELFGVLFNFSEMDLQPTTNEIIQQAMHLRGIWLAAWTADDKRLQRLSEYRAKLFDLGLTHLHEMVMNLPAESRQE